MRETKPKLSHSRLKTATVICLSAWCLLYARAKWYINKILHIMNYFHLAYVRTANHYWQERQRDNYRSSQFGILDTASGSGASHILQMLRYSPQSIKADLRSRNWIGYMCREIGKQFIAARLVWHSVSLHQYQCIGNSKGWFVIKDIGKFEKKKKGYVLAVLELR